MSDGNMPAQFLKMLFLENLSYQAHIAVHSNLLAIRDSNACALLTPMLERKQAEECDPRDVFPATAYTKHTAFFLYFRHFYQFNTLNVS
jgi:hypothetical protein